MRFFVGFLILFSSTLALAMPDYEREKRWADQVTPSIMVGDPIDLTLPNARKFLGIYTETNNPRAALIVVHGIGVHPDWGIVGTLRTRLSESGFVTLSIQMPVLASEATSDLYTPSFPEAVERIASAVDFLRAKGYQKIAVVSHSLGSRMSLAYFRQSKKDLAGWVALSMGGDDDFAGLQLPILDVYGEYDLPQVLTNNRKRALSLKKVPRAKQIKIEKADHFYNQHEDAMLKVVQDFLYTLP